MKESDIRSAELMDKYLEMLEVDAFTYFSKAPRNNIDCPACEDKGKEDAFLKWGFNFVVCVSCGTLYVSPRPTQESFEWFYRESPSSTFWAETFFPAVAEARRKKLFKPKAMEIANLCKGISFQPKVVIDVGAGWGLFLEEWHCLAPGDTVGTGFDPAIVTAYAGNPEGCHRPIIFNKLTL